MCKRCQERPVYKLNNGRQFCSKCFTHYYERKVFKTIKQYKLIQKGDKIAVAASGGKDSTTLLYLLKNLCKDGRFCSIEAVAIDEGIHAYRDKTLKDLKAFCNKEKIKLHIFSYKKEFGFSLDEALKLVREKGIKLTSCNICGVLRRYLINKKSRELGFAKVATGHNLDDEAQTILMNQFKGNVSLSAKLGPRSGVSEESVFAQRIKPLYFCTEKENMIYSFIHKMVPGFVECPNQQSYRFAIRDFLNKFEAQNPGVKQAIVQGFLEVLPLLKERFGPGDGGKKLSKGGKEINVLRSCTKCGEPASNEVCKACEILGVLNAAKNKP